MQLRTVFSRFLAAKQAAGASAGTIRLYHVLFQGYLTFVRDHGHRETLTAFNGRTIEDYLIHSSRFVKPNTVHNRALTGQPIELSS